MIRLTRNHTGPGLRFEYRRHYTDAKRPAGDGVVFEGEHFGSNTSATDAQGRIAVQATYATREGADEGAPSHGADGGAQAEVGTKAPITSRQASKAAAEAEEARARPQDPAHADVRARGSRSAVSLSLSSMKFTPALGSCLS